MKNVMIVHGCPSKSARELDEETRTYDKHWIPWIREKLEEKSVEVKTPLMPEPWKPNYEQWKEVFEKNVIDDNSILIGHSGGAGFLVRWLGETKKKVDRLILVAPYIFDSGHDPGLKDFVAFTPDLNLKDYCNEIIVFVDREDDSEIVKSADFAHQKLEAKLIELKDKGHFVEGDMGTTEFPELLGEILR